MQRTFKYYEYFSEAENARIGNTTFYKYSIPLKETNFNLGFDDFFKSIAFVFYFMFKLVCKYSIYRLSFHSFLSNSENSVFRKAI